MNNAGINDLSATTRLSPVTHVIFDLDGTLIDTEQWSLDNVNRLLSRYDKHCTTQTYTKIIGLGTLDRSERLIKEFDLKEYDKEGFLKEWISHCLKHIKDIQLMPGVEPLIEYLHRNGIPMAIATSGKSGEFGPKTNHISDIFKEGKYFKHVVHGDDPRVQRLKPFPDIFEVCGNQFEPKPDSPQNVLVFEDNLVGISAAVAAGMQSVLVNDKRFFEDRKQSDAKVVINGLQEFNPRVFGLPPL